MIRERIINQSIAEVEKRIRFLEHELYHNDPITKQMDAHCKFNEFLRDTKGKDRLTEKSIKFINDLDKEIKLHEKRQKTYDANKISKELADLNYELSELNREKYYIDRNKETKQEVADE